MRKFFSIMTILLLLCVSSTAFASAEPVKVGFGQMQIGAVLQAGLTYYIGDEVAQAGQAVDRGTDAEIYLKRIFLIVKGSLVENHIKYLLSSRYDKQSGAELLDMKLGFQYIPYTTLSIGYFCPRFTYFGALPSPRLGMIDYPQMVTFFSLTQRQLGIDVGFSSKYVDINLGVFNGHSYPGLAGALNPVDRVDATGTPLGLGNAAWNDENNMKDVLLNVFGKPIDGLLVWAGLYYGGPLDYWENDKGELIAHDASVLWTNGGARFTPEFGLIAHAEGMFSQLTYDSAQLPDGKTDRADDTYELTSMSYFVRLGYDFRKLTPAPIAVRAQYDFLDPDTMNDDKKHGADDETTVISGGVTYYISGCNAMLYLDYRHKTEMYEILDKEGKSDQTGIANDDLKFQVQVAF
jgi:hypothetical protein